VIVCIIGAYSLQNTSFDVGVMMAFGVLGYLLRKGGFPGAPLVLAMLLGPILERSLQQSLKLSAGDLAIFINKPISLTLLLITALMMLIPVAKAAWVRSRSVQGKQMIF
jgi:putative tricarboxylic transport membrane protein